MEICVRLHSVSHLPDLRAGGTPRYLFATHYGGKDTLLLPGALSPSALKPIIRKDGDIPNGECPCISFTDDAVATLTLTSDDILNGMDLHAKVESIKSLMNVHPATIDTICTRLINMHMAVDLLAIVPSSTVSFLATKKAPPAKGQPVEDTDYICFPVSTAVIDTSEHIIKALSSSAPVQFLHSVNLVLKNSLLGTFGSIIATEVDSSNEFIVEACLSVTVTMQSFILRRTMNIGSSRSEAHSDAKAFTIGTLQFHTANFTSLYNVPGTSWVMEVALPVDIDEDNNVSAAVYCICGGGVINQAVGGSPGPAGATGSIPLKKDQADLTSEQVRERFEQIAAGLMAYMPANTDMSLSKSNISGALSTSHNDIGSGRSVSSNELLAGKGQTSSLHLTAKLSEHLLVRDIAASNDKTPHIYFPDYAPAQNFQDLTQYTSYVETILNIYSTSISHLLEDYLTAGSGQTAPDDAKAVRSSSRGVVQGKDGSNSRTVSSSAASVRFVAELFEPFLLRARNLVTSRSFFICINDKTRALLRRNYVLSKSSSFLIDVLLRPVYSLQYKYHLATQLIQMEKKPPVTPMAPISSSHSIFTGNTQAANAFCAQNNIVYGFNRSVLYYTQAPEQLYNKFPLIRPQLQQSRPAFNELPATYCFTQIDASPMLSPVCQFFSCDCLHPVFPYDDMIFASLFPPVVTSWTGVAEKTGLDEDTLDDDFNTKIRSEEASDVRSASQSRPGSAGFDGPTQLRGKASRQGSTPGLVATNVAPPTGAKAGVPAKGAKVVTQHPQLAEFLGKAARYSSGDPNYIFGNIFCGIYTLLEIISNYYLLPITVQGPSLNSTYIVRLMNAYCNNMLDITTVTGTLSSFQKLIAMPAMLNSVLRSTLLLPAIGTSIGFRYPLLANMSTPTPGHLVSSRITADDDDPQWPMSLRLVKCKSTRLQSSPAPYTYSSDAGIDTSDDTHQSRNTQGRPERAHILSYLDIHSMAKERHKTMRNIKTLIDSWRDDITARYKQICKPIKTETVQSSRTAISYSDIPEENAKMKAIVQAGRQLALRGLQGQILTQNALVTPSILPKISALLSEEKTETYNEYSIGSFKLLVQNEGFVEILSRRILLQLESLAHKGFNDLNDMLEYLLLNIVEGKSLDFEEKDERPIHKGYKLQRRIDKEDDTDMSTLVNTGKQAQGVTQRASQHLKRRGSIEERQDSSTLTSDRVQVIGDSISMLFPDVDDDERDRLSNFIASHDNTSLDTSSLDGINTLMIPQHISLKDINSFLFKAKFLAILGVTDCMELSFKFSSAALARQGQLLSNDRKVDIFSATNISRIFRLVNKSSFRVMLSTMLITGARLSAPHLVKTSADFERLATYMRGPVGVLCACLDNEQSMKLLGTDSCLMALNVTKTLFKSSVSTSEATDKTQGKKGKIMIPFGYDYSEQLLVSALLAYDNFMKYIINKVSGDNVEEVHVWTKNDNQATVMAKLRDRKYNKDDVTSMMEVLNIPPLRNYYTKQFNDLLEGEANTSTIKLPKDANRNSVFPSNESTTGSIAGSVAMSLYDRQPRRPGDEVSEVGSILRRNVAGVSATTSVMSGLSGLAGERKTKTISPELQAELDAMPFYNVPGDGSYTYPPFWVMGAYIYVLWSMKLMDARRIARAFQLSFRKYIEIKQEEYKDDVYFKEHGKRRKTMKDFEDDLIGSDVDSDKSCDTTISADAEILGGAGSVHLNSTNASTNPTVTSAYSTIETFRSPSSLSRLSFGDLKNYKSLKIQKSSFTRQVSVNHYTAIQEYLKTDTIDGGMFAPLPYRFASNEAFMEYLLDSTLPENDKFINSNDPNSKAIMRLCAFLSLAEWLSIRGETVISTYATSLADHFLKVMINAGHATPDSPFYMHQQLRGIVVSLRNMLCEKKGAVALEFADAVMRGSLGTYLIPKAKACPAFLYLRARAITSMNITLLMKATDPTDPQVSTQSGPARFSDVLNNESTRALLNEASRSTIQAYQLASRSKQGGRDDFFRGSTSTYDSYLPAEFLYTVALILFSSVNIIEVIRSIFTSPTANQKEGSSENNKEKIDLMFTEVPDYANMQTDNINNDDKNMETLTDFTSLLRLPEATYSKKPYDLTSDATSTQMHYLREQYNTEKRIKVQKLKEGEEPVKMPVSLLKELKKRAKEEVVDAANTELISSDKRSTSPCQGGIASTTNIAAMMQNKLNESASMTLDNTIVALANATISNRIMTPERTQKDIARALVLASSALKSLILKYPHLGQAWASFSLTQLAMGNVVESRLSSSIATLLAPEAIESWVSWVCCELQEIHGIKSSNGSVNPDRVAEVRNYMRQIEAMGILYTMLRVVWFDICQFANDILK